MKGKLFVLLSVPLGYSVITQPFIRRDWPFVGADRQVVYSGWRKSPTLVNCYRACTMARDSWH